jgi:hypothetical protein
MAQNQRRMIYAKIWTSEQFSKLSDRAKLLYIGTLTLADDDGRLIANPAYLRGQIFTYDDISIGDVLNIRKEVEETKLIDVYKIEDKEYIEHPNWLKYQVIRGDLYHSSSLPNRNGTVTDTIQKRDTSKDKISKDKIIPEGGKKKLKNNKMEYKYESIEGDTPRKRRSFGSKINKEQNDLFIAVGALWVKMVCSELGLKQNEVPLRGIALVARRLWERENKQFVYKDYENLFKHFFKSKIQQEDKISFDLCMSEKYVAKYKIASKNKKQTFAGISNEIAL